MSHLEITVTIHTSSLILENDSLTKTGSFWKLLVKCSNKPDVIVNKRKNLAKIIISFETNGFV